MRFIGVNLFLSSRLYSYFLCVYIHLFFFTAERSLRPHIRLYHTIVPCRCCGDGADGIGRSSCGTCNGDDMLSMDDIPRLEPQNPDGFMPPPAPPLMHGTPSTGSGSSGGVTFAGEMFGYYLFFFWAQL